MTTTFRRRADNLVLRWQGKLDSDSSDRFTPWIAAVVLFVVLAALSLARARSLEATPDLAAYTQSLWLIRHGFDPVVTVTAGSNVYSQQGALILWPLAQLIRFVPAVPLLLVVQSAALALAVIPLWRICRVLAKLRTGASLVVVAVYAAYPLVQSVNLAGFHPEALALPFLLGACYFGLSEHWRRFACCCVIVVLCRADLGLALAGLGVLIMVQGFRRRGALTVAFALIWTFVLLSVIQPHLGGGTVTQMQAYLSFGHSPITVAWGMVAHPGRLLSDLFAHDNLQLLVYLLAPVLFLPILAPRYLLPVVPLEIIYLVGAVPAGVRYGGEALAVTAFLFLATPMALSHLGRKGVDRVTVDRRILTVLAVAGISLAVLVAPSSPYQSPWAWGSRDAVDGVRLTTRDELGPSDAVRASDSMLIVLAQRPVLYELEIEGGVGPDTDPVEATEDVDTVILDRRDFDGAPAGAEARWEDGVHAQGFVTMSDNLGIVVFRRGALPLHLSTS